MNINLDFTKFYSDREYQREIFPILNQKAHLYGNEIDESVCSLFRDTLYFGTEDHISNIQKLRASANENYPYAWQWYVRKNCQNVNSGNYGKDPNLVFGKACHEEVLTQLKNLRNNSQVSLQDLYESFAKKRAKIAEDTETRDYKLFGEMRVDFEGKKEGSHGLTPVGGGLAHYETQAKEKFQNAIQNLKPLRDDEPLLDLPVENRENYKVYNIAGSNQSPYYVVTFTKEGKEEIAFALTTESVGKGHFCKINGLAFSYEGYWVHLCNASQPEGILTLGSYTFYTQNKNCKSILYHCPWPNIKSVWKRADHILSFILSQKEGSANMDVLNAIAELHWLLANMMPTARGNAAISEMLIVTLLLYHGFYMTPYKQGVIGDMEALTSTKDEFIANFSSFREVPFVISPFEKKLIRHFGSYRKFSELPEFKFDRQKHLGWTGYIDIPLSDPGLTHNLMRGTDCFQRRFIVRKSGNDSHAYIYFQRHTHHPVWVYYGECVHSENDSSFPSFN